jgi:hypothetical protein
MITRKLWLALRYPPVKDPQYVRILTQTRNPPPLIVVLISVLLGPLWLVILILANVQYGLLWIAEINTAIVREWDHRTYDLLCLCPDGVFGVHWATAAATVNRNGVFTRLTHPMFLLIRVVLAILLAIAVLNSSPGLNASQGLALLPLHLTIAGVLALMQYQSPVLAVLIAMAPPVFASSRLVVAQAMSGAVYLTLEIGGLLAMILTVTLLNTVAIGPVHTLQTGIGLALIALAFYALLREAIIARLWHLASKALDVQVDGRKWLNWRDHNPHRPRQRTVQLSHNDP